MSLQLIYHPLSSFCHKVLIALYENGAAFEPRLIDLGDPAQGAEFRALWPLAKIPVLRDLTRDETLPETSIIIEYLDQRYPGVRPLIPPDAAEALKVRLWDRFFDLYLQVPMQKIVADTFRAEGRHDADGVEEARATLRTAYSILDKQLAAGGWASGVEFSLADCAAAPALFYAGVVASFEEHQHLAAYFDRLCGRASFIRVLKEAQAWFQFFPMCSAIPERFLNPGAETFARG